MKKLLLVFFGLVICTGNLIAASDTNSVVTNTIALDIDALWVIIAAALVFFMQAGFKCLEVGMVRNHQITSVAMKNMIDWMIGSIIFYLVGYGLMFGESVGGFIGSSLFIPSSFDITGSNGLGPVFFMFQLAFVGTSVTIVSGAMSERTGFIPYLTASIFISLIIYPVFGHWAWGNLFFENNTAWLADLGFIDFAGSTVVHSVGAWVSLVGLYLIGPRLGRYTAEGKLRAFKPNSIPMAVFGVFILWFGWWGFNGGSTLKFDITEVGTIILNTNIAGASAGLIAYFHSYFFQRKEDIYEKLLGGVLGGLVAITASAHIQTPVTSLIMGICAGIVHNLSYDLLAKRWKIDDAVGAIPVHGFCGAFGTLALAVIAPADQLVHGRWEQLGVQLVGVVVCFIWSAGLGYIMFSILKKTVGLRVSPSEERNGITLYHITSNESDTDMDENELKKLLANLE